MVSISVPAKVESIDKVTEFVDEQLVAAECSMKASVQINVAIDEIFANIAFYAYPEGEGDVVVQIDIENDPRMAVLTFVDSGIPYNPLEKQDPDVTLSLEERQIGGLGIFIVKKSMDDMIYERKDGQNILTLRKKI